MKECVGKNGKTLGAMEKKEQTTESKIGGEGMHEKAWSLEHNSRRKEKIRRQECEAQATGRQKKKRKPHKRKNHPKCGWRTALQKEREPKFKRPPRMKQSEYSSARNKEGNSRKKRDRGTDQLLY